MIKQYLI